MTHTTSPVTQAVILFGHGARDPEWAGPMQQIRQRMLEQAPGLHVELAYLELMSPTLDVAVEALMVHGMTRIAVVPVFLAQGGHLKRDLPVLLNAVRQRYPQCEFHLSRAVGEAPGVIAAIAAYGLSALG